MFPNGSIVQYMYFQARTTNEYVEIKDVDHTKPNSVNLRTVVLLK